MPPFINGAVVRPRYDVCDPGKDLVIAARATVGLIGTTAGYPAHAPAPIRTVLDVFERAASRPDRGWPRGSTMAARTHSDRLNVCPA